MSRIEDIRARLDAATPGPWKAKTSEHGFRYVSPVADLWATANEPADADLIAHAPTDLRDLLAVARAAQEVLAQWDIGEIEDSAGVLDALDSTFTRLDAREVRR